VLHACHLEEDIARLPDADETLAGSNGINLSGGQKQRIVRFVFIAAQAAAY
jgi:ABC-type multidrug transport system fused ATPase/permease subunit